MISKLKIQNFAIIESLEIALGDGFFALTGETGAGKSILFHRIINAHQKITQQIKSSNADLLMLYQAGRCDLRAEINSECASDASGTLKSRPSGWTRVTTSIIGFYNHVF